MVGFCFFFWWVCMPMLLLVIDWFFITGSMFSSSISTFSFSSSPIYLAICLMNSISASVNQSMLFSRSLLELIFRFHTAIQTRPRCEFFPILLHITPLPPSVTYYLGYSFLPPHYFPKGIVEVVTATITSISWRVDTSYYRACWMLLRWFCRTTFCRRLSDLHDFSLYRIWRVLVYQHLWKF